MELTKVDFEKQIKNKEFKPIYILYGEEKYELERAVEKIKSAFGNLEKGVNFLTFDNSNIDELPSFLTTVSFFGTEKLAIIKNMNMKIDVDLIMEYADGNVVVCIVEDKIDRRLADYKKIKKVAAEMEFKKMTADETISYIITILKKYQINVTREVAEYLDHRCSNDKNTLINEFKKITSYFPKGTSLTKEDIDLVCAKTLQDEIFTLLDYIVKEDKKNALKTLEEMYAFKEPAIKIAVTVYKQFKDIYLIKKLLAEDKNANITAVLGIHPYRAKLLSRVVGKFKTEKLEQILREFSEYDLQCKQGNMDFTFGLEQIICRI